MSMNSCTKPKHHLRLTRALVRLASKDNLPAYIFKRSARDQAEDERK